MPSVKGIFARFRRARLSAGALFLALLTGGCAAYQTTALIDKPPSGLVAHADVTPIRFFPQKAYQCGPAALATTLNWAGVSTTPDDLTPEVFIPKRRGSLQIELVAATRRHGMLAYVLKPRLSDLLTEVAAGHPVIVLQNLGTSWFPVWHFAVAVGYDLPRRQIILDSGTHDHLSMPMSTFERTWARSAYWALLTLPPDRLPKTASEQRDVAAAIALEQTHHGRGAVAAYRAALRRWPRSETARMGLGNSLYAMGLLSQAQAAFLQATRDHPHAAAAFNNLAQTYADQGQDRKAIAAAKRAIELGGPLISTYRKTLEAIRAHPRRGGPKAAVH
jgi:hypothetical protein